MTMPDKNQVKNKLLVTALVYQLLVGLSGSSTASNPQKNIPETPPERARKQDVLSQDVISHQQDASTAAGNKKFLRISTPMQDQNALSGDTAYFKCQVNGWPNNVTYAWYKDDELLDPSLDPSISITIRSSESSLKIEDCQTHDAASYSCKASNGMKNVQTTAYLTVSVGNKKFLRVTKPMQDQTAISGNSIRFRCRINGWPSNITYTWYKDGLLLDPSLDSRISITTRSWGSRLIMQETYIIDTGLYRCEASNGERRVYTTARLTIILKSSSPQTTTDMSITNFPRGRCEVYEGAACSAYLGGAKIYVDAFENPKEMDRYLQTALRRIDDSPVLSRKCQRFAIPAFCHLIFTPCRVNNNGDTKRGKQLCREDCKLLKHDACYQDYLHNSKQIDKTNCSLLSSTKGSDCVRIGHPFLNDEKNCYDGYGENYRGNVDFASSGAECMVWPVIMATQYPELFGGHNFCRNPEKSMGMPWCFVDKDRTMKVSCNVEKCGSESSNNVLYIAVGSTCGFVLVLVAIIIYCARFRDKKKPTPAFKNEKSLEMKQIQKPLLSYEVNIIRLDPNTIQLSTELGNGSYGKVYRGMINDCRFYDEGAVAFKILRNNTSSLKLEEFKNEVKIMSQLNHPNIARLLAISSQSSFHAMAFEYTEEVDLHEYLVRHSPDIDVIPSRTADPCVTNTSRITNYEFMMMSTQIASGMEYLTSHNFIHRDLAARNILVCGNMELKICNLGVVRDSYLSSYYRSLQGGQMLPIRWMAPESLQSWEFSGKSSVWSFGVLLWEMFSYGLQPYCGYSNHEVLEVISRRQLLTCPDQCPAKVYSLMHECWAAEPQLRPLYKELLIKLKAWENETTSLMTRNFQISRNSEVSFHAISNNKSSGAHSHSGYESASDRYFLSTEDAAGGMSTNYASSRVSSARDDFHPISPAMRNATSGNYYLEAEVPLSKRILDNALFRDSGLLSDESSRHTVNTGPSKSSRISDITSSDVGMVLQPTKGCF